MINAVPVEREHQLYSYALWLAGLTVVYNIGEGLVSVAYGLSDESLSLFGFGTDSFIEVVSAMGIFHMVSRIRRNKQSDRDGFEKTALRITGGAFYALALSLAITAVLAMFFQHQPDTTLPGIIISVISICLMWALIRAKISVGERLNSQPIIADANCSKVCLRMSIVLLVSSGIYYVTNIGFIDAIGAALLAYFSFREGRECFVKVNNDTCCETC